MAVPSIVTAGQVRLWTTEDGVHPLRGPVYQTIARLGDPTWNLGEDTRVEAPDPTGYKRFVEAATVAGAVSRPTFSINARYPLALSDLLRLARRRCRVDTYALVGDCKDPQNFTEGWEKIAFFPNGRISSWGAENFGALASDENAATNENLELSAREIYEFGQMSFAQIDAPSTEALTVDVCDSEACGDCGDASDGCQHILYTTPGTGTTPGTKPVLHYSDDGGSTWATDPIDTLFANENPADSECIGANYVIVSNAPNSLHYINIEDLYAGTGAWVEVNTGFAVGGNPNAIDSVDARHSWIVGNGGYIYFTANPSQGVEVQSAGGATTRDLLDVDAFSSDYVMAVGESNAVVYTRDGGDTWASVTGPAVGIDLTACQMWGEKVWFVGTAAGELWITDDEGVSWTEKSLPGSPSAIEDIEFSDEAEGFMAVTQGASGGFIYRTITAGYEWTVLPDGRRASIPANDRINQVATCGVGKNKVFGAGLDDGGTTGVVVKASA